MATDDRTQSASVQPLSAEEIERRVATVTGAFGQVAGAWLFGSWARGEARPGSDVDVGLVLDEPNPSAVDHYLWIADLTSRLEVALGGRPVDVVLLEAQGPVFCHRVLAEGRRIYTADRDRCVDFESETYIRYLDFRPTWEIAARERVRGMRRWLERRSAR